VGNAAKNSFDPKVFLAKLGTGKAILEFHKNQNIFVQGDSRIRFFSSKAAKVKLTVLSEQGKEAVVGILEPDQFFGEGCLNGHPLRIATTTAMEECVITSITKEAMIAVLHKEPTFSELFTAYLLTRNSRIEEDLSTSCLIRARSDLHAFSFYLRISEGRQPAANQPGYQPGDIGRDDRRHPIPRQFFMNKFRKLGLISYNGKIEVHSSLLSAVLHDKPEIKQDESTSKV